MKTTILEGSNFSGRTKRLRSCVGLPDNVNDEPVFSNTAYIGPDGSTSLSGITPTVKAELELMAVDVNASTQAVKCFLDLGFQYCLHQNALTLSGGEQVVTAILAAAAGHPKRIAIDCSLEQLSSDTRTNLLKAITGFGIEVMIADNRINEWHTGPTTKISNKKKELPIQKWEGSMKNGKVGKIELIDLCFSYDKERMVFSNLNLTFEQGEFYHLTGANGAGKTTLSKILCGLLKPTSGEIRINDVIVQPWRNPGHFVGYHFQNPDFQLFATSIKKQLGNIDDVQSLVNKFGIDKPIDTHPLDLPYVLKKRLALAMTINSDMPFTVLDEPTLGQDKINAEALLSYCRAMSGFVISHSQLFSDFPKIEL